MHCIRNYAFLSPLFFIGNLCAQGLEVPELFPNEVLTAHTAYTTSFSHRYGQAYWVAYTLDANRLVRGAERPGKFRPDPKIKPSTPTHEAYTKTGFDRGHLAPAADMAWSEQTMNESFYTSNICPQVPGFNRGIWKNLETDVRSWALKNNPKNANTSDWNRLPMLFIATGPIFSAQMRNISRIPGDTLAVPEYFFKAILDTVGVDRAVGFIIPNSKIPADQLWNFAMSIDELEAVLGRDLFPQLPDEMEEKVEAVFTKSDWD